MSRATDELLDGLHGDVAQTFIDEIKAYKDGGKHHGEPIPASLLANAARFLKDNGIDSPAIEGGKIDQLSDVMPDLDVFEGGRS